MSPLFHASFFIARASYNINAARPVRSAFVVLYLALLIGIASLIGNPYEILFFAVVVPIIIGYQISAFIEICSEHAWFDTQLRRERKVENDPYFYADISWGRFCGEEYPDKKSGVIIWYLKHVFYHIPVRCLVLVGDLPQHDFHHRKPLIFNWVYAKYERERFASKLNEGEPEYYDIWGFITHWIMCLLHWQKNLKKTIKHYLVPTVMRLNL